MLIMQAIPVMGDNSRIWLFAAIGAAAAVMLVITILLGKKKKDGGTTVDGEETEIDETEIE